MTGKDDNGLNRSFSKTIVIVAVMWRNWTK